MPNIQTLNQDIIRTLHLDSDTIGSKITEDVKREVINAMRYYEGEAPWFLLRKETIDLVSDVYKYPVEKEVTSIANRPIYIPDKSVPEASWPIHLTTYDDVVAELTGSIDFDFGDSTINTGTPRKMAFDASEHQIIVAPVPSTDISQIQFIVSMASQIPSYEHDGSSWYFYEPLSTEPLPDTFSNVWLEYGYDLIKYRALSLLLAGVYGGSDSAMNKAGSYNQLAGAELSRLRVLHNRKVQATYIPRDI